MQQNNNTNLEQALISIAKAIEDRQDLSTGWLALNLENSWVHYNSPHEEPQYRRDRDGWVHLRGLVKNGTAVTIATLPEGFRPNDYNIYTALSNNVCARINVDSTGTISVGGSYSTAWVSLAGIIFKAEN